MLTSGKRLSDKKPRCKTLPCSITVKVPREEKKQFGIEATQLGLTESEYGRHLLFNRKGSEGKLIRELWRMTATIALKTGVSHKELDQILKETK